MHRCQWAESDDLMRAYHDTEWGVPLHEDRKLFEFLVLDGAQAGLSWSTVLKKRDGYRRAFDDFDARKIVRYSDGDVSRLMSDSSIVRNRRKIASVIVNAEAFLRVSMEFGTFDRYIWQFVSGRPLRNTWKALSNIPTSTDESRTMSKDLVTRGFTFVGPTICYAFMQAAGMVNDHVVDCFRYREVEER